MKRRISAALLTLCLLMSLMPSVAFAAPNGTFDDVDGHWGQAAVERWAGYGVVNGDGSGNFAPDNQMTRAEFATMLANMLGYKEKAANTFADVNDSDWFADAILKLAAAGVMQGSNGMANPNAPISRQEAAVMMCRAFNIPTTGGNLNFADSADVADWAKGAVAALAARGMMNGVGGNNVAPLAEINRASVATLLDNMITEYVTEDKTITGEVSGIVLVAAGANVTLEDATLNENLIVAPKADGAEVTLTGTTTAGDVVVGATATVKVDSTASAGTVQVEAANSTVEVAGKADAVTVDSAANNTAVNVTESAAVGDVALNAADTKVSVAENATVSNVAVSGSNANVEVSGKVDNVTVSSEATGTDITANSGATVGKVETSANDVTVSGSGKVENVTANDGTVAVTTPGTNVENKTDSADNVTSNGQPVEPSTGGDTPTPTPPSSSGSSGSGSSGGNTPGVTTKAYKITYVLNGGENPADAPAGFDANEDVTLPTPTRAGYTFDGWYTESTFTTKVDTLNTTGTEESPLADVTLYAKWNPATYTVTLDANGGKDGTKTSISGIEYDAKVGALPTTGPEGPTRTNWNLLGWATTATAEEPNVTADTVITEDTTFYAVWKLEEGAYLIEYKYIASGEDVTDKVTATNSNPDSGKGQDAVSLNGSISVVGYEFANGDLYKEEGLTNKVTSVSSNDATNNVVTIYVSLTEKEYAVTYNVGDKGTAPTDETKHKYTGEVTLKDATAVAGYTFKGWTTAQNPTEDDTVYKANTQVTISDLLGGKEGLITLYAVWVADTYTVTYKETDDSEIAVDKQYTSYEYGTGLQTLPTPEKNGYTFGGWHSDKNCTDENKVTSISATDKESMTLYAKWTATEYKITYNLNDGTNGEGNPDKYTIESDIITLKPATRTGYKFLGWFNAQTDGDEVKEIAKGSIGNITLYARWEAEEKDETPALSGNAVSAVFFTICQAIG